MGEQEWPGREEVRALVELVRFGQLTYDERDALARLVVMIDHAVRGSTVPAGVGNRDRWVASSWEPVGGAYAELVAVVDTTKGVSARVASRD